MSYGLGIDVGSSFVKVAISRDGRTEIAVLGEHSVLQPTNGADQEPDSLSWTLRDAVANVAAGEGELPSQVVATYPVGWNSQQCLELQAAAVDAGLDRVGLVTTVEAAATSYARSHPVPDNTLIAVYDLGGHTFDVAVVKLVQNRTELIGIPISIDDLGGHRFDDAVLEYVKRTAPEGEPDHDLDDLGTAGALERIRTDCIEAKERLSYLDETSIMVLLPGHTTEVHLSRAEFDAVILAHLERTISAVRECLSSAGTAPHALAGVLLVGGSSRIRLVAHLLTSELGLRVLETTDPQYANAIGAAQLATEQLPSAASGMASVAAKRGRNRARTATALTLAALGVAYLAGTVLDADSHRKEASLATIITPAEPLSTTSATARRAGSRLAAPSAATPNSAALNSAVPNGAVPNGAVPNGAARNPAPSGPVSGPTDADRPGSSGTEAETSRSTPRTVSTSTSGATSAAATTKTAKKSTKKPTTRPSRCSRPGTGRRPPRERLQARRYASECRGAFSGRRLGNARPGSAGSGNTGSGNTGSGNAG